MLNIYSSFKEIFSSALTQIALERAISVSKKDYENFNFEPAKEKSHGDLACNAAMVLSKKFAMNPRELAQELIKRIFSEDVEKFEIAGPGFINISLKPKIFYRLVEQILTE